MRESLRKPDGRETKGRSFLTPERKEAIKRLLVGCIFVLGAEAAISPRSAEAQEVKPATIESVAREESQRERNLKMLRPDEHLIPESVMKVFNEVYVSFLSNFETGTALGFYIDQEGLRFLKARKTQFEERIKQMGLSEEEVKSTEEIFKVGNIIFGQDLAENPRFAEFLLHERVHKYISEDLSPSEQKELDKVKNFLEENYWKSISTIGPIKKGMEEKFSAEVDALLKSSVGMKYEEYKKRERAIVEKYYTRKEKTVPILTADNQSPSAEFQLYYIVQARGDELWSTLIQGNFTGVEAYIKTHFPAASLLYERIKAKAAAENK